MSDKEPEAPATPRLNFGSAAPQETPMEDNKGEAREAAQALTDEEAFEQFNAVADAQAASTVEEEPAIVTEPIVTSEIVTQDVSLAGSEEVASAGESDAATEEDTPVAEETPSEEAEAETAVGVDADDGSETYGEEAVEVEQAEPLSEETADEPEPEAEAAADVPAEEADAVVAEEPVEAVADVEDGPEGEPEFVALSEPDAELVSEPVEDADPPVAEAVTDEAEAVVSGAELKTQKELEAEAIEAHRQQHADEATERLHNTEVGPSIEELREQEATLQAQIKAKQDAEKESVLSQIKTVVTTYGITTEDLVNYLGGYKPKRPGVKAIQKYKDPASGATWSGRGKAPAWIKGQDYNKFLTTQP